MRFKRFACVAGAVALSALSLAPLSATVASADYVNGGIVSYFPDGYINAFGGYTFTYSCYSRRVDGYTPFYTVDIPRFWGAGSSNDSFSSGVATNDRFGVLGQKQAVEITNRMDSGYLTVRLSDFAYGYGSNTNVGSFQHPFAYIRSTPDTVACLVNVFDTYIGVVPTFDIPEFSILHEVRYTLDVRARDNSGNRTFTGSCHPADTSYATGTGFRLGDWLYNDIGLNFMDDSIFPEVAYANQSTVEKYFTTTKGIGHTENGANIDVYVPTCFYGYLSIEFYAERLAEGGDVILQLVTYTPNYLYSNVVAHVNDYYASTLVYDTVGDAFGSVLDVPRVFFSTDIVLGFSFGDLLLIALGVFLFGLGLKIALGG